MLRSKSFVKITNRGSVVKVVKEHYLRDDIGCGLMECPNCPKTEDSILDPLKGVENSLKSPLLIVPDTNVFLHHLDVFEMVHLITDVVVLQTVLDEVRNRNPNLYQRLRKLIAKKDRRFYVFSNEHHREAFAGEKSGNESDNDRNDRAIRTATEWYQKHLQGITSLASLKAIMISNDMKNVQLAKEKVIGSLTLSDFCQVIEAALDEVQFNNLKDMLLPPSTNDDSAVTGGVALEEHLSEASAAALIKSGKAFEGVLQVSHYNCWEAVIKISEGNNFKVSGRAAINRAIQGDTVIVIPIEENAKAVDAVGDDADEGAFMGIEAVPLNDGSVVAGEEAASALKPGKIVRVVKRQGRSYCGSIDRKTVKGDGSGTQSVLVVPLDKRIPRIRIRTRQANLLVTQRLLIAFDGWEAKSIFPHGHLIKPLGQIGDRATETEAILLEHDVAYTEFTRQVFADLPAEGEKYVASEEEIAKRWDLRHLDICSVDPPGCTDIDDALHARPLPNGNIEVGVHIADVTHFVKPGTAMDLEASSRATTVYLVDRRIDMLPALLGSNLCSLMGNVERLAFSCIWEMTPQAEIVSTKFGKSIIKSRAALTYDMAQKKIEQLEDINDPISRSLHCLNRLAQIMKQRRVEAGALTLASPEVRFTLDLDSQNPVDVELKEMKAANSLVEEFMLLANCSVAAELQRNFPQTALLRRHPTPPAENFAALNEALVGSGINPLEVSSSKALANSLDSIEVSGDSYFNKLVRIITTRCMLQAVYFSAGTLPYPSYWHYGLATPIYTHFTSPIRRYADVLVHRLLHACIDPAQRGSALKWDCQKLEDLCSNLNYRNRMAQQASRSSIELFTHLFFRGKMVQEEAYVIKVMSNAIVCLIPKYGIEGLIKMEEDPILKFDESKKYFTDGGAVIVRLFQKVVVELSVKEIEASQREKLSVKLVLDACREDNRKKLPKITS